MYVSFIRPKPQPEHDPAVLARATHIQPGVTSNTSIHLWDLRKIQGTRLDEVVGDLMLEPGDPS
jgi:hypothetical protein